MSEAALEYLALNVEDLRPMAFAGSRPKMSLVASTPTNAEVLVLAY